MNRSSFIAAALLVVLGATQATAEPPLFKQKKFFGPIPINNFNVSVGFVDGPNADYLTEHLDNWAKERSGYDNFETVSTSPFARIGYQRRITPNHYLTTALSLSYLKAESLGNYVTVSEPPYDLDIERTFKVYLFSLDVGFSYFMVPPQVHAMSPYFAGGFCAVLPMARLETHRVQSDGTAFSPADQTVSRNSLEAGLHGEFGMIYYLTNHQAAGMEGRYHMSQSKFYIHDGNFDINYQGFTLSLNYYYYF